MDLRRLSVFVAVAEERGFSKAAERLSVAQSAVSATIRSLEKEWQVDLFHRTTHRVELSAEGLALLPHARRALLAADTVNRAVNDVREGLRGTLRIGIMQAAATGQDVSAAAHISSFARDHPHVEIVVRQGGSAVHADAVRAGELDLAYVGLPSSRAEGLQIVELLSVEMVLACHRDHPFAKRGAVQLADLTAAPFVDLPPTWGIRIAIDQAFAAAGLTRTIAYEINDLATTIDFVRHGLAVAITGPAIADDPAIARVPIRRGAPTFALSLIGPSDRPEAAVGRAFREHLLASAPRLTVD